MQETKTFIFAGFKMRHFISKVKIETIQLNEI